MEIPVFMFIFSAADRLGTRQSGTAGTSGPSPAQRPAAFSAAVTHLRPAPSAAPLFL
jgi:hypothetical protein